MKQNIIIIAVVSFIGSKKVKKFIKLNEGVDRFICSLKNK